MGEAGLGWAGLAGAHLPVVEQLSRVGSRGAGDNMSYSSYAHNAMMLGF